MLLQRDEAEFENGCSQVDLYCDEKEEYTCFCKPCIQASEVDVYHVGHGEDDPHLHPYYGDSYPSCSKMEICATIQQGETVTLRIYDNMAREDADITVEAHAGDKNKILPVKRMPGTFGYEFEVTDREVQVQVIEIIVDGEPILSSPIRVVVEDFDCEMTNPGEHKVPNPFGECSELSERIEE